MNVQPVCDMPTFIHGPNPTVNGPGTYTVSDWATIIPGPFEDSFMNIKTLCDDDRIDVTLFPNGTLIFTIPSNTYGDFKVSTIIQYRSPCDGANNHGLTTQVFTYQLFHTLRINSF
ncbi:MAG: hypothetical protein OMM_11862 [Candidatus Magnetoglobus multicellularis str. Araruama]|uniref:Uncharacterized protein n=1 Tax=Candidatus Magnetoglobus multicellularis str. Araruama TaxID=890399 RepID=A0A1V1NXF7_9BACT|nr:MAG: hypothetical protein OMM_11862 [Candidatus Magnetoglobus multicellularis str. Araruama]